MTEPVSSSLPTCRDLIQSIVAAVDARDVYTAHHSDRVAAMAVVLARVLHLSEDDTTTVQVAAFAHDIGKISMSDAVLRKAGKPNSAAEPGFWQTRKVLVKGGICCGIALFAASAAQQMGIGTTSTAKAGFMTALYVVLVPVFGVLFGHRPGVKLWCCVAASVVGLYLLCLAGHDSLTLTGGEWQLLGCAFLFATQILLVDHFSPKLDGIQLSFVQFLTVAVISTVFMLIFEQPTIEQFRLAAVAIAYCGIMSSGVAYTLQIVGQKALDPTIASLAMCLESVFSALAGWLILGETLSTTELCGCGLMFAAIVASQLPDKKKV